MKICVISIVRPYPGSGDGITDYTYQFCKALEKIKGNKVVKIYALQIAPPKLKGLIYTHTIFKFKLMKLLKAEYDIVHIMHNELGFAAKYIKKAKRNAKCVTTIHDFFQFKKELHKGLIRKMYFRIARGSMRDAMVYSDYIVLDSSQTAADVKRFFGTLKHASVISCGIKERILKTPVKKRRYYNTCRIGYLGSFAPRKNVISLLRIATVLRDPEFEFDIYGKGTEYTYLKRYKELNSLSNVNFMGFAEEEKICRIFDSFDIFIFPTQHEGFGFEILEAQARGLPVIIYKSADIPKEVRKFCFEAKNENDAADIIKKLRHEGYNAKLKENAMKYAKKFNWDITANEMTKVYKRLLG